MSYIKNQQLVLPQGYWADYDYPDQSMFTQCDQYLAVYFSFKSWLTGSSHCWGTLLPYDIVQTRNGCDSFLSNLTLYILLNAVKFLCEKKIRYYGGDEILISLLYSLNIYISWNNTKYKKYWLSCN